jgi:hypothetical protein
MEGQPQPDIDMIALALEDHSYEANWWLDPKTGEVVRVGEYGEDDDVPEDPDEAGWLLIEPADGNAGYRAIAWLQDQGLVAPGAIPVDEAMRRLPQHADRERDPKVAYDQLVFSLGRAKAAVGVLADADPVAWQPVARAIDEASRTAASASPPA